jgi:hypothetical protein
VTLAEAPQHLLRKLEREVLKNLSREKRELRKRVNSFDYFLFCFVAFSSALQVPRNLVATRRITSTAGGYVYGAPFKYENFKLRWEGMLQWSDRCRPYGARHGSISSYKHFAPTALWQCNATSRRSHYQNASRRWIPNNK